MNPRPNTTEDVAVEAQRLAAELRQTISQGEEILYRAKEISELIDQRVRRLQDNSITQTRPSSNLEG